MSAAGGFLPFSAVVGQEQAKLALILAACDRRIGGVLLRGDKGSAKSTLARGLAALLPGGAPFVELPIGATEDRVVGTLDLAAALTGGEKRFDPGLLHAADGGMLYVDEINLLPDHLVDVLLDVAASGVNRVEREGVSHSHPSRFVLVGSMNPEEGDLRPQLLDRFGLAVEVRTPASGDERLAALRRRLDFDSDPAARAAEFAAADADVAARLARVAGHPTATIPDRILEQVAALCGSVGAEGLRADLTICRAAAALAGWEGRPEVLEEDVRRVAPLALAHRARRDPLDTPGHDRERLEEALDAHFGGGRDGLAGGRGEEPEGGGEGSEGGGGGGVENGGAGSTEEVVGAADAAAPPLPVQARPGSGRPASASGRRSPAPGARGRLVGDREPNGPVSAVAVGATVRRAAARVAAGPAGVTGAAVALEGPAAPARQPEARVEASDVRQAVYVHRSASLVVIAVDASGSMGAARRMEAAKGAVISLLRDAYQRRDLVSLVAFRGDGAQVLLRPTSSVEVARARLAELPTGGRTPLAAGIRTALDLTASTAAAGGHRPVLVVITDGRATSAPDGADPFDLALATSSDVRRAGVPAVVIDAEAPGGARLGLARRLAEAMGASYVRLSDLTPAAVEEAVRRASSR